MPATVPSRHQRRLGGLVVTLVVALLTTALAGLPVPATAASGASGPAAVVPVAAGAVAQQEHADRVLDFHDDASAPRATSRGMLPTWRKGVVRYRSTLPAAWEWSLRTAVRQWNASGASVRLVRTSVPRRAQLQVTMRDIGPAAGLATVGRTRGAFVRLSSAYRGVDATDAYYRVEVMAVLAHELGHVLGLGHVPTRCALMGSTLDVAGCGLFSWSQPGRYRCDVMGVGTVARAARLYGGRARAAAAGYCLIDVLPGQLRDVAVVSDEATTSVSWTPPASAPAGSVVRVTWWSPPEGDTCETAPAKVQHRSVPLASRTWSTSGAAGCVEVRVANRYGLGPAPARPATAV